jgi:flagellar motor switch protein FliN/FliY
VNPFELAMSGAAAETVSDPHDKTQLAALPELMYGPPRPEAAPLISNVKLFRGVKVRLHAVAGEATMSIGELTALKESSVLPLDRTADALVDVMLEDQIVARGQLVVVGDNLGVRITELAPLEG